MLNSNTIKNETIGILETSAGGLFDFEKMPDHIKYEQEDDGRAKLNSNNEVVILKQYEQPALELILSAIDNGIIEAFKTSGTLDDFSDVEYNNLSKNDLLIYDGVDWVNSSVSGINLSGNNVSSHKIPLNYVPKSDGIGGWKSTNIYEDVNGLIKIKYGTSINEFSIDGTLAGNSDLALPTEKAVKTYVDSNAAHNLLSNRHSDTLADSVVDGDIIIGNSTPKWSKLVISIPAANVRNVLGIDNGELRPSWKTALDGTNPTTIGINDTAAPGTSLVFSHRDHQHASPATWTPSAHNVLDSTYHGDVLTGSITRGDILYGNSTPKIARLAKGNDGQYLKSGATDVVWADLPGSFSGFANPSAAVGNTVVNGSATTAMRSDAAPALGNLGTAGVHAKFGALGVGLADSLLSETANDVVIGSTKRFGLGAGKGGLAFTDAATDTITFDNCNVGIGTISPEATLDVRSQYSHFGSASGDCYFNDNSLNFNYVDNSNQSGWINYVGYNHGNTQFRDLTIGNGKANAIAFFDGSTGNFGIGTTSPGEKLEVTGNIKASGTLALTPMTLGSVPYFGANGVLTQNNSQLFWDATNLRFGLGLMSADLNGGNGKVVVSGTKGAATGGAPTQHLWINDNAAYTVANRGGSITFGAKYDVAGTITSIAAIESRVEADAAGTYDGSLAFLTRTAAGGTTVKMIIKPNGNVGIGTTAPLADVGGSTGDFSGLGLHIKAPTQTAARLILEGESVSGDGYTSPGNSIIFCNRAIDGDNEMFLIGQDNGYSETGDFCIRPIKADGSIKDYRYYMSSTSAVSRYITNTVDAVGYSLQIYHDRNGNILSNADVIGCIDFIGYVDASPSPVVETIGRIESRWYGENGGSESMRFLTNGTLAMYIEDHGGGVYVTSELVTAAHLVAPTIYVDHISEKTNTHGIVFDHNLSSTNKNISAGSVNLNDNAATSFTPGRSHGMLCIHCQTSCTSAIIAYDVDGTVSIAITAQSGSTFAVTTGDLDGTTGTDGKFNVSVHTDGKIYLENRTGGT